MEEIISYIMETPENVNGNILREKLQEFKGSGGDDSVLVSLIDKSITEIKNDKVMSVGVGAFYGCSALTAVDLPNVASVGETAFMSCSSLSAVNLPNATSIGEGAFAYISTSAVINLGAAEGEIEGAPWGAPEGITINYNVKSIPEE